jgi:hypothetical protein
MTKHLNKKLLKQFILCDNTVPRRHFKRIYAAEIDLFVERVYDAYKLFKQVDNTCNVGKRNVVTAAYIYTAINNLVSSFNIFISGYTVPSGNLMRHFYESSIMALLFSAKKLKYFEKFDKNPGKFQANKVFEYAKRNLNVLGINSKAWKYFIKQKNFYHSYSHSSAFAMSTNTVMDPNLQGTMILGSFFDKGKKKEYEKEIQIRIGAVKFLTDTIKVIRIQLN